MKILLCISTLKSGGAEKNISFLANYLAKDHEVTILTFDKLNSVPFYKIDKKIKVVNLNLLKNPKNFLNKLNYLFLRIKVIRRFIKKNKFNLYISFINTMNITLLISTLFLNIKKIISDRNNPFYSRNTFYIKLLKIIFYNNADKIVLQTNGVKKFYWFVNQNKIEIITNFFSTKLKEKKIYKLSKKIKLLVVSKLEKQKGILLLLNALVEVRSKFIIKCDIFGKGSYLKIIKKQIKKKGLENAVFLKGVKNLNKIYHRYDLFILPSLFEGYPNALVEAMIVGLPVISSNCNYGPSEIIKNKSNGILFRNKSSLSLSKSIEGLLNNYSNASILGKNAKKKYFSKIINDKNLDLWQKIINQ